MAWVWALALIPVINVGLPMAAWSITRKQSPPRAAGKSGAEHDTDTPRAKVPESRAIRTRPIWSILVLAIVGVFSFFRYSHSQTDFFLTAATVIATLFVAIALGIFAANESRGNESHRDNMSFEHWVFMIVSSAGLLAALRGLSVVGQVHHTWQKELLTGLTVAGVTAAVLLVAERLVARQVPRTAAAFWWTMLFLAVTVGLAIFPG
jgi:hypothetical protein